MNDNKEQSDELLAALSRILKENLRASLATLIVAPRELLVGAKLLIEDSGEVFGSFGDPALERAVAQRAQKFLASRDAMLTLNVEAFAHDLLTWRGACVMFERIEAEPRLVICGAGHVGAALAHLANLLHRRATLIDDRAEFVKRELFPENEIELVIARDWVCAVRDAVGKGIGVALVIVTRGHKEDEECLRAALATQPDYIGMIGSRRRTNIVLARLREEGADEERLRNVRAPIGLNIKAVTPEEVALAILAEIIAERRGGTGTPLSAWRREKRMNES